MYRIALIITALILVGCDKPVAPEITSTAITEAIAGEVYQYVLEAEDPDTTASDLSWEVEGPNWLSISEGSLETVNVVPRLDFNARVIEVIDGAVYFHGVNDNNTSSAFYRLEDDGSSTRLAATSAIGEVCFDSVAVENLIYLPCGANDNNRIIVFNTDTNDITEIETEALLVSIIRDRNYLFGVTVIDDALPTVVKIELANPQNQQTVFTLSRAGHYNGIAIDPNNPDYIYVTESVPGEIIRLSQADGGIEKSQDFSILTDAFAPSGLEVDRSGNIYVSDGMSVYVPQFGYFENYTGIFRYAADTYEKTQIKVDVSAAAMHYTADDELVFIDRITNSFNKIRTGDTVLEGTPPNSAAGNVPVIVRVIDQDEGRDAQDFNITVATGNSDPTGSVTISGTLVEGETLTASNTIADDDGLGVITYRWFANEESLAIGETYTLTSDEVETSIVVRAQYTDNAGFEETVSSEASDAVEARPNEVPTGTVTITGTLTEGSTLTATNDLADADGLGTITYQWLADGVAINGATSETLLLTSNLVGSVITVTASFTDGRGFSESEASTGGSPIAAAVTNPIIEIGADGAIMAVLLQDGTVQVWGDNTYGTLGHTPGTNNDTDSGTVYYNPTATTIGGLADVIEIEVGYRFILALKDDGTVWAWGRNENGELGHAPGSNSDAEIDDAYGNIFGDVDFDGFETYNATPVQIASLTNVIDIAAAYANGYALRSDGTVWAWGDNFSGQLGDGGASGAQSGTPVQVNDAAGTGTLSGITAIFAGDLGAAFAIEPIDTDMDTYKDTRRVWAWGANSNGQLGLGNTNATNLPVEHSLTNAVSIGVSGQLSAALLEDGTVSYWGDTQTTPTDRGLTGVSEIAVNGSGAIALLANGTVQAWGVNSNGQLGNGVTNNISSPTAILASDTLIDVVKGEFFSAALLNDGTLKVFGLNDSGQLGHTPNSNGDTENLGSYNNLSGVIVSDYSANSLGAPDGLAATVGADLVLNWNEVAGAESYNVYWTTSSDVNPLNGTKIEMATRGAALQTLTQDSRYNIIVTAIDSSDNESAPSLTLTVDFPVP